MTIFGGLVQIIQLCQSIPGKLNQILQQQANQSKQLAEIIETLTTLTPAPAAGFTITLSEQGDSHDMAAKAKQAGIDFQLFDNGQAVATLTVNDAAGLPTELPTGASVPAWTSSDPGVLVSAASDGMSAIVSPAQPPVLVTGATLTVTSTESDGVTKLTGTSEPIDVVGSAASGFSIALK